MHTVAGRQRSIDLERPHRGTLQAPDNSKESEKFRWAAIANYSQL